MKNPYRECNKCPVKSVCKYRLGEYAVSKDREWCNANYRILEALKLSRLKKRFLDANIFNYIVTEYNKEAYSTVKEACDNILDVVYDGTNFILLGEKPGTGKTFNACVLLNQYIYRASLTDTFDFENPLGLYVDYTLLIDRLRYLDDKDLLRKQMEELINVPLLLLDDVGAGKFSDFAREQTYILVNERYERELSTIVTSNLSPKELASNEALGRRVMSRLFGDSKLITLSGSDMRFKKGVGNK